MAAAKTALTIEEMRAGLSGRSAEAAALVEICARLERVAESAQEAVQLMDALRNAIRNLTAMLEDRL